jgi:hypothetical protein
MMDSCVECARLEEHLREKAQSKQVAENALALSGSNQQFARARKVLDAANLEWLNLLLQYQDHMQQRHPRTKPAES